MESNPAHRLVLRSVFLLGFFYVSFGHCLSASAAAPSDKAAQTDPSGGAAAEGRTSKPEEDDYSTSPFTEYGEFNETSDEEADSKFFKFGRFFGVSLGLGFQFLDGNRNALWEGGFPLVDFKFHYWFDFNIALDLGFYTVMHNFTTTAGSLGHTDINFFHVGVDVKYYFDTRNISAAISFANPYVLLGVGAFSKSQNSSLQGTTDPDNSLGISMGGGVEFAISPRKTYFELEAKIHLVTFKDTFATTFQSVGIENLVGNFYTVSGNILFTW